VALANALELAACWP
jgi:hypothetical protein